MEPKKNILTKEGLEAYEEELKERRLVRRPEIANMLKEARAQGDLSENAELDAARDEQTANEARIKEIEEILKYAEIVDESEGDEDTVNIGCTVKILDIEFNEEMEFRIVGSTESDMLGGKISNESPVGSALIGAKAGDTVTAVTESGDLQYKVLEVHKSKGKKSA